MFANRLIRLRFLAVSVGFGSLGLGFCGCGSNGGASPAFLEKKEDQEKRESTIKELYKTKKSGRLRTVGGPARSGLNVGLLPRTGDQVG